MHFEKLSLAIRLVKTFVWQLVDKNVVTWLALRPEVVFSRWRTDMFLSGLKLLLY